MICLDQAPLLNNHSRLLTCKNQNNRNKYLVSTSPAGQEDRIYEVFERQARSQLCFSSQIGADANILFQKLPSHEVKSSIFLFFIYLFISIHSEFIIYCKFKYFQDTFMAKLQKDWVQLVKQCKNSGYTLLLCLPILTAGILITIIK